MDQRQASAGARERLSAWRKLSLVVLIAAEVLIMVWIARLYLYTYLHGSLTPARVVSASVITGALFLACIALSLRWGRAYALRGWLLPPALFLAANVILVAVDPGGTWSKRYMSAGGLEAEYSFIPVSGGPSGIVVAEGAVWLACRKGNVVVRVDPVKMRVADAKIAVGRSPEALAVGQGALWVTNRDDGTVSQIDLKTYQTATVRVGREPGGIACGEGAVWVANYGDDTVSRIDPSALKVTSSISVGINPRAVAVGFGAVWVANYGDGTVSRLDPDSNQVVATISVDKDPACLASGREAIWVTDYRSGTVSRIDPERNVVAAVIPVGKSLLGVAAGEEFVWVVDNGESALYRIDPRTNETAGRIKLGQGLESPQMPAIEQGILWVSNYAGSLPRVRLLDTRNRAPNKALQPTGSAGG